MTHDAISGLAAHKSGVHHWACRNPSFLFDRNTLLFLLGHTSPSPVPVVHQKPPVHVRPQPAVLPGATSQRPCSSGPIFLAVFQCGFPRPPSLLMPWLTSKVKC